MLIKNRLKVSENFAYNNHISPSINFNYWRFKEQLQNEGPWGNLLNSDSNAANSISSLLIQYLFKYNQTFTIENFLNSKTKFL